MMDKHSYPPGGPSLRILRGDWHSLRLGYDAASATQALRAAASGPRLFTAEPGDIEEYHWSAQRLLLSASATRRLGEALAADAPRLEGIEKLNDLKEGLGDDNLLARGLYGRPFAMMLGEQFLYGGIFLDGESQMAIKFPVARVRLERGRSAINFLPVHLPFFEADPLLDPHAGDGRPRDVPPRMMDYFQGEAASPLACEQRRLIQDPRVRAWLEASGRLR